MLGVLVWAGGEELANRYIRALGDRLKRQKGASPPWEETEKSIRREMAAAVAGMQAEEKAGGPEGGKKPRTIVKPMPGPAELAAIQNEADKAVAEKSGEARARVLISLARRAMGKEPEWTRPGMP